MRKNRIAWVLAATFFVAFSMSAQAQSSIPAPPLRRAWVWSSRKMWRVLMSCRALLGRLSRELGGDAGALATELGGKTVLRSLYNGTWRLTGFTENIQDSSYSQTTFAAAANRNVSRVQDIGRIQTNGLEVTYSGVDVVKKGLASTT